ACPAAPLTAAELVGAEPALVACRTPCPVVGTATPPLPIEERHTELAEADAEPGLRALAQRTGRAHSAHAGAAHVVRGARRRHVPALALDAVLHTSAQPLGFEERCTALR